jgi:hypothetical protein
LIDLFWFNVNDPEEICRYQKHKLPTTDIKIKAQTVMVGYRRAGEGGILGSTG